MITTSDDGQKKLVRSDNRRRTRAQRLLPALTAAAVSWVGTHRIPGYLLRSRGTAVACQHAHRRACNILPFFIHSVFSVLYRIKKIFFTTLLYGTLTLARGSCITNDNNNCRVLFCVVCGERALLIDIRRAAISGRGARKFGSVVV